MIALKDNLDMFLVSVCNIVKGQLVDVVFLVFPEGNG